MTAALTAPRHRRDGPRRQRARPPARAALAAAAHGGRDRRVVPAVRPRAHALSPEVVLLGLLPPLLYAAAITTSLVDLKANRVAIAGLSVGLVLFTATGVGVAAWLMLPVPFAVAFALGAVVAPPDAVAATAVARSSGLPRRVVTILEGESLLNDATALVALSTALAASGLASDRRAVSLAVGRPASSSGRPLAGVGHRLGRVCRPRLRPAPDHRPRRRDGDLLPRAVRGLPAGRARPRLRGARRRDDRPAPRPSGPRPAERRRPGCPSGATGRASSSSSRTPSSSLIGLQATRHRRPRCEPTISPWAGRPSSRPSSSSSSSSCDRCGSCRSGGSRTGATGRRIPTSAYSLVASWAGMRGVVTLAAALLLPLATPQRPVLAPHRHGRRDRHPAPPGDDPRPRSPRRLECARAGPSRGRAPGGHGPAGRGRRPGCAPSRARRRCRPETSVAELRDQSRPSGQPGVGTARHPRPGRGRDPQRGLPPGPAADAPGRTRGAAPHPRPRAPSTTQVLATVLGALDVEESTLELGDGPDEEVRETPLLGPGRGRRRMRPPPGRARTAVVPASRRRLPRLPSARPDLGPPAGLPHLRQRRLLRLLASAGTPTAHFAPTGHPVMRSLEPGEAWRWCYVDEVLG